MVNSISADIQRLGISGGGNLFAGTQVATVNDLTDNIGRLSHFNGTRWVAPSGGIIDSGAIRALATYTGGLIVAGTGFDTAGALTGADNLYFLNNSQDWELLFDMTGAVGTNNSHGILSVYVDS